jgi:hypothetical protein
VNDSGQSVGPEHDTLQSRNDGLYEHAVANTTRTTTRNTRRPYNKTGARPHTIARGVAPANDLATLASCAEHVENALSAPTYGQKEPRMSLHQAGSRTSMKFMLLMSVPNGPYEILTTWPKQDLEAHGAFMNRLNAKLEQAGELVAVAGLVSPDKATLVRGDDSGLPITDGVFPESKEFLAGYWIIEAATVESAHAIAAEASMAPGPGGKPLHTPIEVREIMFSLDVPPKAKQ